MKKEIYNACCDIIDHAYSGKSNRCITKSYKAFKLSRVGRTVKKVNGQYIPEEKRIIIFNWDRKFNDILLGVLHEIAHHIVNIKVNDLTHSALFYREYEKLLTASMRLSLFSLKDLDKIKDNSRETSKIIKKLKESFGSQNISGYQKDTVLFRVKDSFLIKDEMVNRKYNYDNFQKIWWKEIPIDNKRKEELDLRKILRSKEQLQIISPETANVAIHKIITIYNGVEIRDVLKPLGYRYNSKTKAWSKRVLFADVEKEISSIPECRSAVLKVATL
ncbi:MAG: hypothetical protein GX117_01620 [Candidatus Hydrogenedentes bacterium]|nr:hypothetical protein [Candidatus Hydrogenedentota bacterium]